MQKAVSTYVYVKERLHPGLLDDLVKAGAQSIEIFAARQHFDYGNRKQHVREIADWFRSTGVPLNSVHAPLYSDYEWGRSGSPPVNIASTEALGATALHSPYSAAKAGVVSNRLSSEIRDQSFIAVSVRSIRRTIAFSPNGLSANLDGLIQGVEPWAWL